MADIGLLRRVAEFTGLDQGISELARTHRDCVELSRWRAILLNFPCEPHGIHIADASAVFRSSPSSMALACRFKKALNPSLDTATCADEGAEVLCATEFNQLPAVDRFLLSMSKQAKACVSRHPTLSRPPRRRLLYLSGLNRAQPLAQNNRGRCG
jgi:hypothetical protein